MKSLHESRLYTFVDTAYLKGREPEALTQQLCDGGSDLVQLRAKDASPREIRLLAEALLPITTRAGVALVINDYSQIAIEVGAPLCHLGQEDFFGAGYAHVSQITAKPGITERLSETLRVGLSTHSPAEALRALAAEPDYIAIGPVFATATKPTAKAVTLDYVRWAAAHVHIPWFAIGGINLQNLQAVIQAGARRVCVVSAILNEADVVKTCQQFKQRLLSAPQN